MKYFRLEYNDGSYEIKKAKTILQLIKDNELYTKEHINTHIVELSGEQLAIAISNEQQIINLINNIKKDD